MPQPAQIRIVKGSEIGDAVFQHRDALYAHAKGKSLIFGRIDTTISQHLWVDHATAEDLEPVAARADLQLAALARAADIDFGRRLGERKIARAETHRQIVEAEKGAAKLDQA